jgi:uncharacterized protein
VVLDRRHGDGSDASPAVTLFKSILITALIAYGAIALGMYLIQRQLQYLPGRQGSTPAQVGLDGVETVNLTAADGTRLVAWHAPAPAGRPTILFFHGNGGELADRAERLAFYRDHGYGALFLSYRGYGASEGRPSEAGLMSDAVAAYEWLLNRGIGPERIVIVGESLGSGVAVQLAAARSVAAIALEAPFTSAADIARMRYWWLPISLLMKDQFRSIEHIARIRAPLLILHGSDDGIVPIGSGRRLFEAARDPKEFVEIAGGTHVSIFSPESWAQELAFFDRHLGP